MSGETSPRPGTGRQLRVMAGAFGLTALLLLAAASNGLPFAAA